MSDLQKNLRMLSRVDGRTEIGKVMTVQRINAIQDALMYLARGDNIRLGKNFKALRTGNAVHIEYNDGGAIGGKAKKQYHPFEVIILPRPKTDPEWPEYNWGVYWDSQILNDISPMDFVKKENFKNRLPKELRDKNGDDVTGEFWFDMEPTDAIYVEGKNEDGWKFEIKTWANGGDWDLLDTAKIDEDGVQKSVYHLIGFTLPDKDGKPEFYQMLHSNLLMGTWCYGVSASRVLLPYDGSGYGATIGAQ